MTFNEECECTLIGQILRKPEIFRECVIYLTPESFSLPETKRIYSECTHLFSKGAEIDPLAVVSAMGSEKEAYKQFLTQCIRSVITTENHHALIRQIHNDSIKRRTFALCTEMTNNIDSLDTDELREKVSSILSSFDKTKTDSAESIGEMHTQFMKYLSSENTEIKTGLAALDKTLTIDKGDFVVIGGRPSSGKTALALQLAMNIAKTHKVAFFSLETSCVKVFTRMLSSGTGTDIHTLRNKEIFSSQDEKTADLWKRINNFVTEADKEMNFSFVGAAGWTTEQIRSKALQLGAEVIFIDYMTLVRDDSKSAYERATGISMRLHTLAQSEGIAVFALAQLNRQSEHQEHPSMADLRESGQIEQDADSILLLSSKRDTDVSEFARRTLYIVKNKDGETGDIDLIFQGRYQKFLQA